MCYGLLYLVKFFCGWKLSFVFVATKGAVGPIVERAEFRRGAAREHDFDQYQRLAGPGKGDDPVGGWHERRGLMRGLS